MNASAGLATPPALALTPSSITHQHILSIINTERPGLRILDAGCGAGKLTAYLRHELHRLLGQQPSIYGLDVSDSGFNDEPGFFQSGFMVIRPTDEWPFPDGSLDCVVSNQVLEHVKDLPFFLSQVHRVLRDGGISIHLFPFKNVVWEDHIQQPLTHWILNRDLQRDYCRLLRRLGFRATEDTVDSQLHFCFYRSYSEITRTAKMSGLRPSLRYTQDFYFAKLRSLARMKPKLTYKRRAFETIPARMLSFVSSITLFLEKKNRDNVHH